jgi:hypothetical protein
MMLLLITSADSSTFQPASGWQLVCIEWSTSLLLLAVPGVMLLLLLLLLLAVITTLLVAFRACTIG